MSELLLAANLLLWIGFIVLLVVVFALVRQVGILFERIAPAGALGVASRLGAGDAAPAMRLTALGGDAVDLGTSRLGTSRADGLATLLLFVAPDCPICKHLLPVAKAVARRHRMRVVYASAGAELQVQEEFVATQGLPRDSYVVSDGLGLAFGVAKLPFAALLSADGRIAALGLVNTREHLESLVEAERTGVASIQEFAARKAGEMVQQEGDEMDTTTVHKVPGAVRR